MSPHRTCRWLGVLAFAAACAAQAARPPDLAPVYARIVTTHGSTVEGELRAFSWAGDLALGGDSDWADQRWPSSEIISIESLHAGATRPVARTSLHLANGDHLVGDIIGASGETVHLAAAAFEGSLNVELSEVVAVITPSGHAPHWRRRIEDFVHGHEAARDVVLLANRDLLHGFVTAIDANAITLDADDQLLSLDVRQVIAARLVTDPPTARAGLHALVQLTDGSRLTVTQLDYHSGGLLRARFEGETVKIPVEHLRSIRIMDEARVPLSSLAPASVEETPLIQCRWGPRIDERVTGGALAVAGKEYASGIGVHARSVLRYELNGAYRGLVVAFGLDDSAGPLATVTVKIIVDGKARVELTGLGPQRLHGPIWVDVSAGQTLELAVEPATHGPLQDRFAWINPVLIK